MSIINTATNTVSGGVGGSQEFNGSIGFRDPEGAAALPVGNLAIGGVEVANTGNNTVAIVDTATNTITGEVAVGDTAGRGGGGLIGDLYRRHRRRRQGAVSADGVERRLGAHPLHPPGTVYEILSPALSSQMQLLRAVSATSQP